MFVASPCVELVLALSYTYIESCQYQLSRFVYGIKVKLCLVVTLTLTLGCPASQWAVFVNEVVECKR